MSTLGRALLDQLDADDLAELKDRLGLRGERREDGWLTARDAAAYLGLSVHALHRLTAERAVPFHQDGAGHKLWFKRSELDQWRVR